MVTSPVRQADTKTRDRDVRALVLSKALADHASDPNVRVVEEMGLEHGSCRVDIAVVNGFIHGFEIKSDADSLDRLPRQVDAYSRSLDRATLVVGEGHLAAAETMLPQWWGIKVVRRGKKGGLQLFTHRPLQNNPNPSLFHMAPLMWRSDVVEVLREAGASRRELGLKRAELYKQLVETLPSVEVRRTIRAALKSRENWRRPEQPS